MVDAVPRRVANPPEQRPLMLYDGECNFCCRWVERFKQITREKVDFATSQSARAQFPEISPEAFDEAVWLVTPEGQAYGGAEAVYKVLAVRERMTWINECYECSPLFAKISDVGYAIIARNRMLFSRLTRFAWGAHVATPGFRVAGFIFPKALGVVAMIALISLWVQMDGLVGSQGILPAGNYFEDVRQAIAERAPETSAWALLPSVFWWIGTSDAALHGVLTAGLIASAALIIGFVPPVATVALWITLLSLTTAGQVFYNFQWDVLLIQCAFFTVFFVPWRMMDRWKGRIEPARIGRYLLWTVLFLIMIESGLVKIQSYAADGGNTWREGTALNYHYWTQPLPSWTSWYIDQLPEWVDRLSIWLMLSIELILPFFFFAPRRLRHFAACGQILLQALIIASGNYGFFNLLMLTLCIPLFDDGIWPDRWRKKWGLATASGTSTPHTYQTGWKKDAYTLLVAPVILIYLGMSALQLTASSSDTRQDSNTVNDWLRTHPNIAYLHNHIAAWRTFNSYGLFRVMTTDRPEIEISGSMDAITWTPYEFNYKPGAVDRPPQQVIPGHMPRLDWQMWFAALQFESSGKLPSWMIPFLRALAVNQAQVMELLKDNPFPDEPPKFFRLELYDYTFAHHSAQEEAGAWWQREKLPRYTILFRSAQLQGKP